MDIATLGFRIDSSQAVRAAKDLDRLHDNAKRAEGAVEKLDQRIRRMKALPPVEGGMSREASRPPGGFAGAAGGGSGPPNNPGPGAGAPEDVDGGMGRAAEKKPGAKDIVKMGQEVTGLVKALKESKDPLMTFIEHGWKIAEVAVSAGASISQWAVALGLTNPVMLAIYATVAVLIGAFAMFQSDLNKHAKDKAYLDSLGFTKDEIDKLGKSTVTTGDVFKGFWMTLNEGNRVTKVFEEVATFAKSAFSTVVEGVTWVATSIGSYWVTVFKTVAFLFENLGGMVEDAMATAANAVIDVVNGLLKGVTDGFNDLGQHLNRFFGKELFGKMEAIKFDPVDNASAGKMKAFGDIITGWGREYKALNAEAAKFSKTWETNSFRANLERQKAEEKARAGQKTGGASASAMASATAVAGCGCPDGTARDASNDNDARDPFGKFKLKVYNAADDVLDAELKAVKPAEELLKRVEDMPRLLSPLQAELEAIGQDLSKSFSQAIANGQDLGDALSATFKRIAASYLENGINDLLGAIFKTGGTGAAGTAGGGDFLSTMVKGIGGFFGFDGGGYTGDGARSGGIDGKGGFLAVMHPRETVIDHTKGGGGGGGQAVQVTVSVSVDDDGRIQAYVRDSSVRAVQAGISQYDAGMPQRVAAIGNDPRRR